MELHCSKLEVLYTWISNWLLFMFKEIGLCLQIFITGLHPTSNTIGRAYVSIYEINKHALPMTVTKSREVPDSQSGFCICFFVNLLTTASFVMET